MSNIDKRGGGLIGPGSSTDNAIVRWDGTGGTTLQDSGVTIDDNGKVAVPTGSSAGYTFNDGDTGIYENGANTLAFRANSITVFNINQNALFPSTNYTPQLTFNVEGSAAGPSYAFKSATNSGMYYNSAASELRLSSAGTDALTIDNTQNVTLANALAVGSGGTGATTLTDGGPLLGSGTGAITALGQPTNGQLIVGSTGVDPVLATLTGTANEIDVTNGAGSITLALSDTLDLSGNSSFAIPTSATPTVNASGEIALDTTITSHDSMIRYHDGTNEFIIPAIRSADLTTTDNHVIAYSTASTRFIMEAQAGGGGGTGNALFAFDPANMAVTETNFATLELITMTNVKCMVRAFDDTTEEYTNFKIIAPTDLDTSGTVTFRAYVVPKTAAASKNVGMTFGHAAVADDEDIDSATYTDEDSGAVAVSATQNDINLIEWTETVTNLGWAAEDQIFCRLSRDPTVTNDLTGDLYLVDFQVDVPRA